MYQLESWNSSLHFAVSIYYRLDKAVDVAPQRRYSLATL